MSEPTIFRMFQGEVLALFPTLPGTIDPYTCLSYAHMGQHASADPQGVVRHSRPATRKEYAALLKELRQRGYRPAIKRRLLGKYLEIRRRAINVR